LQYHFVILTNKTALLNGISNDFFKVLLQGIGPAVGAIIAFSILNKTYSYFKGNYKKIFYPFMLFGCFL
jgi:hypothetical protein